jgi:hypothetical protein
VLASAAVKRISGSEKFRSPSQRDFCNNIDPKPTRLTHSGPRTFGRIALRESEARLQTAAELVGLGWSYWKPGCSDVEWDDRLKVIWGLSRGAPVDLERATAAIHRASLRLPVMAPLRNGDRP